MPDNRLSYAPDQLPLTNLDYRLLLPLVGQANAALARYDGLLQSIPNPTVMLSPLTTQEAVLSSKIEGTQATVDEVLQQEAGLLKEGEKFQDIQEISNYRQALYAAREHLKDYPIRLSFVRELHRILMSSVRGQDKTPGEFRNDRTGLENTAARLSRLPSCRPIRSSCQTICRRGKGIWTSTMLIFCSRPLLCTRSSSCCTRSRTAMAGLAVS
jgi:Fic family protein